MIGYVDHIVDEVGRGLVGSSGRIAEAVRRRRVEADASDAYVERLLGLTLGRAQVERGHAFVEGVLERAGQEGLGRLWSSEAVLPTPPEVDAAGPVAGPHRHRGLSSAPRHWPTPRRARRGTDR